MKLRQHVLSLHKQFGAKACQELRQLGHADVAKELTAAIRQLALRGQADAQALVMMVATCLLRSIAGALHLTAALLCRCAPDRLPTPVSGGSRMLDGITQHGGRPMSLHSCAVLHWRKQQPASTRHRSGKATLPCQATACQPASLRWHCLIDSKQMVPLVGRLPSSMLYLRWLLWTWPPS